MISEEQDEFGFTLDPVEKPEKLLQKWNEKRMWTEHKAELIAAYLKGFCWVTKSGVYLDAFSGPQDEKGLEDSNWAAKNTLELTPRFLKQFVLFEKSKTQITHLELLKSRHTQQHVEVVPGDMNEELPAWLEANPIKNTMPTFCLVDQRNTECDWKTLEIVAAHKKGQYKIEIFYFLPVGWIQRSTKSSKDRAANYERWLGPAWEDFPRDTRYEQYTFFVEQMQNRLGYKYVMPLGITDREGEGGELMFYMIHASDHPEAPKIMNRAYRKVTGRFRGEPPTQFDLFKD